jgi:23S rRNA (guanosine2251-2'-O)-methyltransferase
MKNLTKKEIKELNKEAFHKYEIILVLENIQYASNVAGIFRTADAGGVNEIFLTGATKTPPFGKDLQKASRKKEKSLPWRYFETSEKALDLLKKEGYMITALELTDESMEVTDFLRKNSSNKIAILAGNEVSGVQKSTLNRVDNSVYLPMLGKGSSLNVGVSIGIFLYNLIIFNK